MKLMPFVWGTLMRGHGSIAGDRRAAGKDATGSRETWMAFVSPSMPRRGDWSGHQPIVTAKVAATLIEWMRGDWKLFDPATAPPVPNP